MSTCKEAIDLVCGKEIKIKTAEEMFKEEGYKLIKYPHCIEYSYGLSFDNFQVVKFLLKEKEIYIHQQFGLKTFKAIQKQIEELEESNWEV